MYAASGLVIKKGRWSYCLALSPSALHFKSPLTDTLAKSGLSEGSSFPSYSFRAKSLTLCHDLAPEIFIAPENALKALRYQMKVSLVISIPASCGQFFTWPQLSFGVTETYSSLCYLSS